MRLAREKERELKELERATRTVFAFNLNIKADERDIWEFFSKVGAAKDGGMLGSCLPPRCRSCLAWCVSCGHIIQNLGFGSACMSALVCRITYPHAPSYSMLRYKYVPA